MQIDCERRRLSLVSPRMTSALSVLAPIVALSATSAIAQQLSPAIDPSLSSFTLVQQTPTTQLMPPVTQESRYSRPAENEIKFQEGLLHYNTGHLVEAEGDFKDVLATDPSDAQAYYYLGLSQLDQNRAAESVDQFNKSLRLDPSPDEVRAARATALIRLQRFDEAKQDLATLRTNPRFASLADYLTGQMLYDQGDLEGASKSFAAAKAAGGTESVPAGFYEGLTYIRMRELVRARSVFRESSVVDADRDPTLAAASRQLDAVLALQQRPSKPWEAQITFAYENDSNVIQLGSNVSVPVGISGKSDWRFVVQPRGSYSLYQADRLDIGIEGNGYFTWEHELSGFDISSYQAGPYINYRLTDNLFLSARYGFNYVELGHDPFLVRNVFTPQLTYVEKDFGYTSVFYQFETRQFDGVDATPALNRDGHINSIGIVQGLTLPELFKDAGAGALELSYRFDDQETKGGDFDAKLHTFGATFYTPLPIWKLRADVGVSFGLGDYDNPNSLDTSGDKRNDFEFDVSTGLTKQFTKNIAMRVDYTHTTHDSNVNFNGLKPYEYDRDQFGVRLIFSF